MQVRCDSAPPLGLTHTAFGPATMAPDDSIRKLLGVSLLVYRLTQQCAIKDIESTNAGEPVGVASCRVDWKSPPSSPRCTLVEHTSNDCSALLSDASLAQREGTARGPCVELNLCTCELHSSRLSYADPHTRSFDRRYSAQQQRQRPYRAVGTQPPAASPKPSLATLPSLRI